MPLASLIGAVWPHTESLEFRNIIDKANLPDNCNAGLGQASDATIAMELGCDGVLMNTAIALAEKPILMASAMRKAVESGREAFIAGRNG